MSEFYGMNQGNNLTKTKAIGMFDDTKCAMTKDRYTPKRKDKPDARWKNMYSEPYTQSRFIKITEDPMKRIDELDVKLKNMYSKKGNYSKYNQRIVDRDVEDELVMEQLGGDDTNLGQAVLCQVSGGDAVSTVDIAKMVSDQSVEQVAKTLALDRLSANDKAIALKTLKFLGRRYKELLDIKSQAYCNENLDAMVDAYQKNLKNHVL